MTELKPCPFCGSSSIDPKGWASEATHGPACDDCGASAGEISKDLSGNIAAWNTRTPPPVHVIQQYVDRREAEAAAAGYWRGVKAAANYLDGYAGGHYMAKSSAAALRALLEKGEG